MSRFSRTEILLGNDNMEKLKNASVCIFGVGGVGGYVCEGLARSGVSRFALFDNDTVSESNINRQIIALTSTIGRLKVDVMKERILDINPNAVVECYPIFVNDINLSDFDFSKFSYVADCIDTITAKIQIIAKAKNENVKVISAMGAGNKLDPLSFEITDISKTSVCPLARIMRLELKKRNINHVKVCYSKEVPFKSPLKNEETNKPVPASISFVPPVVGLLMAREIILDITSEA